MFVGTGIGLNKNEAQRSEVGTVPTYISTATQFTKNQHALNGRYTNLKVALTVRYQLTINDTVL